MPKVRDVMATDLIAVWPELPLDQLLELFIHEHIAGAPVLSEGRIIGVVDASDALAFAMRLLSTSRGEEEKTSPEGTSDFTNSEAEELPAGHFTALWAAADAPGAEWSELSERNRPLLEYTAADVMSSDFLSLPSDTDVAVAADFLRTNGAHRGLVMEGGQLRGIFSGTDMVNGAATQQLAVPHIVSARDADFDVGQLHDPLVPDSRAFHSRSLGMPHTTVPTWSYFR